MKLIIRFSQIVFSVMLAAAFCPALAHAADGLVAAKPSSISVQASSSSASGSKYKATTYQSTSVTVAGATFWAEKYTNASNRSTYKITMTKSGVYRVLADDTSGMILTNGRYLFYSKYWGLSSYKKYGYTHESKKYALYRLDLKTGKRKKLAVAACDDLIPYDCDGPYVYYGLSKSYYGADLYSLKVSNQKKRLMATGVKGAACAENRVIAWSHHNVGVNVPVYSFKKGGTGKKQIVKAMEATVIKNKVYYIVINDNSPEYRKYRCTLTGKSKKAVSRWTTNYSSISF